MGTLEDPTAEVDPNRCAVPVALRLGDDLAVGTGFLGRQGKHLYLFTAGHNLASERPPSERLLPIEGWGWLHKAIEVYAGAAAEDAVPLDTFTIDSDDAVSVAATRLPRFSWAEPAHGLMNDVVRFGLADEPDLSAALSGVYDIVELDSAVDSLTPGDDVTCVGFPPGDGGTAPGAWPYFPPTRRDGPFLRVSQSHWLVGFRAVGGLSGGPAFTPHGQFAGMFTGGDVSLADAAEHSYMVGRLIPPAVLAGL